MSRFEAVLEQARRLGNLSPLCELIPYAAFLGMRGQIDNQGPCFELPFDASLIGNSRLPALHGGVIAGFMENAALVHVIWAQAAHRMPKSIDFSIDYLRSGRPETVWARCEVARQGRRVAQVQIRAWQSQVERPIAIARAHFLLKDVTTDDAE